MNQERSFARRMLFNWVVIMQVVLLSSGAFCASGGKAISGDLVIFHAGSLSVPFKQISDAFTKEHPGIKIKREAGGSRACARKISDLGRDCDVFGSADYTVIDTLLIPDHAQWCIPFACNEMVIVYGKKSRASSEINSKNWPKILLRDDVAYGRADPNSDPCGYRSVLTVKLAETHYAMPGMAKQLLEKDNKYIRPKETDLLALLEVGEIDYLFIYRSVAEQHHLKYITLPDQINLKKKEMTDIYKKATIKISGKTPGTFVTKKGQPIIYGVTIPKNARNREAALVFVAFLLSKEKGMAIMRKNGQPSIVPAPASGYDKLPEQLKSFALMQPVK
jgi:molybdate/tungstate transport system substrate-binding protein